MKGVLYTAREFCKAVAGRPRFQIDKFSAQCRFMGETETHMKSAPILLGTILCTGLTACATTYNAPKADAPHATLELKKGYKTGVGFGTGTQQEYSAYEGPTCAEPVRLASFTWTDGDTKTKRVNPNAPLIIGVSTNYFSTSGGYWNGTAYIANTDVDSCRSFASFSPSQDSQYSVVQTETGRMTCEISVVETSSGQPPVDLVTGLENTCTDLPAPEE